MLTAKLCFGIGMRIWALATQEKTVSFFEIHQGHDFTSALCVDLVLFQMVLRYFFIIRKIR